MARPKKPTALALVDGSATHHPDRYPREAQTILREMPLGPPSPLLDMQEMEYWCWFVEHGCWLTEADRVSVEQACIYRKKMLYRTSETKDDAHLLRLLEKLGFTPVTRGAAMARWLAQQAESSKTVKKNVWAV
mgnify:CR=1 FL=1